MVREIPVLVPGEETSPRVVSLSCGGSPSGIAPLSRGLSRRRSRNRRRRAPKGRMKPPGAGRGVKVTVSREEPVANRRNELDAGGGIP